jgi:hypothetical protein
LTKRKIAPPPGAQYDDCQPELVEGGRFYVSLLRHMKVLLYTVFKDLLRFIPSRLNSAGETRHVGTSSHTIEMIDRLLGSNAKSVVDLRFLYAGAIA